MTNKYFININQRGVITPVYCEDTGSSPYTSKSFTREELALYYDIISPEQVLYLKERATTGNFSYKNTAGLWSYRLKISDIYGTLFRYKSKVKGILKLRKFSSPDDYGIVYDDANNLFIHKMVSLNRDGFTWSQEALPLMLEVLREQYARWLRIQKKYTNRPIKEQLCAFIKVATGQDDFYYGEYFSLLMILNMIPEIVSRWENFLNANPNPVDVNAKVFDCTYFVQYGRSKDNFKLGALGSIFKSIKKPLTDLLSTFTTNSVERKFLEYKKV